MRMLFLLPALGLALSACQGPWHGSSEFANTIATIQNEIEEAPALKIPEQPRLSGNELGNRWVLELSTRSASIVVSRSAKGGSTRVSILPGAYTGRTITIEDGTCQAVATGSCAWMKAEDAQRVYSSTIGLANRRTNNFF